VYAALIFVAVIAVIFMFSQSGQAATVCGSCQVQDVYGYSELLYLASQAGFGADSSTAAAIALAESGGKRTAVGDLALGRSIGLWQINLRAHPEYSEQELYDAQTNANAAYQIYSSAGGFSPWTTFRSGAYQNFVTG
jgi:Lysozyme like domain